MTSILSEELKKVVLAGIGATAMTLEKSKELVDDLVERGEMTVEQGKVLNEELKHNIKSTFDNDKGDTGMDLEQMTDDELTELAAKLAEVKAARKETNGKAQK